MRVWTSFVIVLISFCFAVVGEARDCDRNESAQIDRARLRIPVRLKELEIQVASFLVRPQEPVLKPAELAQVRMVQRRLLCMEDKFPRARYQCGSRHCDEATATIAHVNRIEIPFILKLTGPMVTLCEAHSRNLQGEDLDSVIFHEISHQCGTDDLAYGVFHLERGYMWTGPMRSVKEWSANADHYRYWYARGFCVPGYGDCLSE